MKPLKYKVIKGKAQYNEYCEILGELKSRKPEKKKAREYIELLTLLTNTWESQNHSPVPANASSASGKDPVVILRTYMKEQNLKSKDLVGLLGVSKGLVSDMLNYKKGFSKDVIRTLSTHFQVSQETFNRPYSREKGKKEIVYQ